jgi:hypothetical protein
VADRAAPERPADGEPDGDDLATEVARLVRVSRAFRSSPVVASFRDGVPLPAAQPARLDR